ncbi:helitron_like_N domain-containing protein [Caerostris extrusa]|uniref:Helitron_like_N domain-containing protein n=1 Tax=Caerostris extrusa TaxID=172846 RepID=A0AAV4YA13_CAEEX|nr:helitron_like_N domain-containing protein [Caerostris extrusa]
MSGVENPVFRGPRVEPAPARNVQVETSRKCFEFRKAFWECSKMEAILQVAFAILYLCACGGNETNKKVCSMCYYAYRLMIRNNQDNCILRYRQLYHQYVVDMYAKIESERLQFLRFNQVKLRSEDYIHLRDAIIGNNDENLNTNNIGNGFILPSSYIGSPRNMQEYIQDAMTYGENEVLPTTAWKGLQVCERCQLLEHRQRCFCNEYPYDTGFENPDYIFGKNPQKISATISHSAEGADFNSLAFMNRTSTFPQSTDQ